MGKNPPTIHEWWHLPSDKEDVIDKEMAEKYMQWLMEQYASGEGTFTFEEYLEKSQINN